MSDNKIEPHKITKPIQLLGAWLAGLAIINSTFLIAASKIIIPSWLPALLTIAAVANVPVFIISLFILQTKFRPEMQEDSYYSKYLERKFSVPQSAAPVDLDQHIAKMAEKIVKELPKREEAQAERVVAILKESEIGQLATRFEPSRSLSELYLHPDKWSELVQSFEDDAVFQADIQQLSTAGLILLVANDIRKAVLTPTGREVAQRLADEKKLWNQNRKRHLHNSKSDKP